MFKDFKNSLLHFYAEQKANNKLSDNLMNPTRVNLKNECLTILKNRYDKKDDEVIQKFFDPKKKWNTHQESIDDFELDGFQALITFFKRDINIQKEENIKFLAWLIDFEPRPYTFEETYSIPQIKKNKEKKTHPETYDVPTYPKKVAAWKYVVSVVLTLIVTVVLAYQFPILDKIANKPSDSENSFKAENNKSLSPIENNSISKNAQRNHLEKGQKQCMFWNQDHYEAIACNQEVEGASIIALNQRKLTQQKKITNLDTIGTKDIGRTWYFKTDRNNIDLFTDSGSYPLDEKRVLRPLTIYMLNKYILSKR